MQGQMRAGAPGRPGREGRRHLGLQAPLAGQRLDDQVLLPRQIGRMIPVLQPGRSRSRGAEMRATAAERARGLRLRRSDHLSPRLPAILSVTRSPAKVNARQDLGARPRSAAQTCRPGRQRAALRRLRRLALVARPRNHPAHVVIGFWSPAQPCPDLGQDETKMNKLTQAPFRCRGVILSPQDRLPGSPS